MKTLKNLLGVPLIPFEVERSAQAVCSDDRSMVRQRELNQRYKARVAALSRSHFLAHHARVAIAKKKNQAAARNSFRAKLSRFLNYLRLRLSQSLQEDHRLIEEGQPGLFRIGSRKGLNIFRHQRR